MSEINPYQASIYTEPIKASAPSTPTSFSYLRSFGTWTLVCGVAAAPSFIIATSIIPRGTWPAMLVGIAIFIVLYVLMDYRTHDKAFRQRKAIRYSLYATYILRLIASIIFPIGTFIDLMCGFCSAVIVSPFQLEMRPDVPATSMAFLAVFLWTITHAIVMHVVLLIVWVSIWLFLKLMLQSDEPPELRSTESELSEKYVVS
ncbi:hypothetical protein VN12_17380 [Pirellula sp. SH-Sr6A]|uniref:hypothetical protein n=1 Tax=Pirellula sp. SH-Sr6A TaxID=1632865 RepID=UPI00078E4B60|nr:hypothetical protein [Pirellula sp. SH-Sr6A]AMV33905.1 hypothetical protein VN12_17380 [Pirellula sp. SH-Sr6A]